MMRVFTPLQRYRRDEGASPTIEFVTTLPLLMVAFVFAFEFSNLFWAHHIATNNVRSALRYLSRAPLTTDYITDARNIARTGDPDTSNGAYDWMNDIEDSDIDINTTYDTFTTADFRVNGQILRIQMDVPYSFITTGIFNNFTANNNGVLTLNIIEEARYFGE